MFWLVQIAILGPLPFVLLGASALHGAQRGWMQRQDRWNFVISFFFPLFAVFLLASFKTEVHVNWTAPSYLSLIVAGAAIFQEGIENKLRISPLRWRQGGWIAVVVAVAAVGLAFSTMIWGIPGALTYSHAGGWRELAASVKAAETELARVTALKPFVLGADKYNIAAELSFYTREPENQVNHLAYGKKGFGFRYWTQLDLFEGRPAVAVVPKLNQSSLSALDNHFDRIDPPKRLDLPTVGTRTRTMRLIDCYGYRVKPHGAHRTLRSSPDSGRTDSKE